jgi:parallel beta-helix repeat protein
MKRIGIVTFLAVQLVAQNPVVRQGSSPSGDVDFSNANTTKPARTGGTLPGACTANELFFLTNVGLHQCVKGKFAAVGNGGTWGTVGGAISAQTDLWNTLQNKQPLLKGTQSQYVRGDGSLGALAPSAAIDTTDTSNVKYTSPGAGAVQRTQADKNSDTVSVKDYGATGAGVVNETAYFTAAVNSVSASGGTVTVPCGTYKISNLSIPAGVTLNGNGKCSILKKNANGPILTLTGANPAVLSMYFDGNYASYSGNTVVLYYTTNASVKNSTFINNDNSGTNYATISGYYASYSEISGNVINTLGRMGIYLEGTCTAANIHDNDITVSYPVSVGNGPDGISIVPGYVGADGSDVRVVNNRITSNGFCIEVGSISVPTALRPTVALNKCTVGAPSGLTPYGGYSLPGTDGANVMGNTVSFNNHDTQTAGIELPFSTNCNITGNTIDMSSPGVRTGERGIILESTSGCNVTGNRIINMPGNGALGIFATTSTGPDVSNNNIAGNVVSFFNADTSQNYGIQVQCTNGTSTCSNNTIVGNTVTGSGTVYGRGIIVSQSAGNTVVGVHVAANHVSGMANCYQISSNLASPDITMIDNTGHCTTYFYPTTSTPKMLDYGQGILNTGMTLSGLAVDNGAGTTPTSVFKNTIQPWNLTTWNHSGSTLGTFRGGTAQSGAVIAIQDDGQATYGSFNQYGNYTQTYTAPISGVKKTDGSLDQKWWIWDYSTDGQAAFRTQTDAFAPVDIFRVYRTGGTPTQVTWNEPITLKSYTYATLPTVGNGSLIYCSDCNATCTGGSSAGRTCFRENGAWTH